MKYTVEGFQQESIVNMGLDYVDVGILRWFVDFISSGRMSSMEIDGEIYYWIKYGYLIEELPVLRIKDKEAVSKRLDKMVLCGLLEKKYIKNGGNYTYFRIVPEAFATLITSSGGTDKNRNRTDGKPDGYRSKTEQGTDENRNRVPIESRNKDPIINDPSISNNNQSETFQESLRISRLLLELHLAIDPKFGAYPGKADAMIVRWSKDVDKLIRLDSRSPEEIERVLRWAKADSFWSANIMSGKKLREKFPTLLVQMQRNGPSNREKLKVHTRTAMLDMPEA